MVLALPEHARSPDPGRPDPGGFGERTEEVLIEAGLSWDDLSALKDSKAIL